MGGGRDGDFAVGVVEAQIAREVVVETEFDPQGLVVVAVLEGRGEVARGGASAPLGRDSMLIFAGQGESRWSVDRGALKLVEFWFSDDYLGSLLDPGDAAAPPSLQRFLASGVAVLESSPLARAAQNVADAIAKLPSAGATSQLWFRAKAIEFLSAWAVRPVAGGGGGVSIQSRMVRERLSAAKAFLDRHLAEPLDLDAVARVSGCSRSYLSRLFSAEEGMTLSRYLRMRRIQRASELMAAGRANVGEAALEVGYQSMSHFARAFRDEQGISPSEFLARL